MTPIAVTPLRVEKALAFVCPGGLREVDSPVYPEHPRGKALRSLRVACDVTLGDAARIAGITPAQLSGLEHGRYALANDTEWCELYAVIAAEYERRGKEKRAAFEAAERGTRR